MMPHFKSPMLERIIRERRNREILDVTIQTISIITLVFGLFFFASLLGCGGAEGDTPAWCIDECHSPDYLPPVIAYCENGQPDNCACVCEAVGRP